jgi:hypothetical protein
MGIVRNKRDLIFEKYGKPNLLLDFAGRKKLFDSVSKSNPITFSRSAASSPGTYVGSDGLIKTAAVNLALYSERFDNGYWSKTNVTTLTNQIASPDGKQTADEIAITSGGYLQRSISPLVSGQSYTLSYYLKAGTTSSIIIQTFSSGSYWMRSIFDLSSGTVSSH